MVWPSGMPQILATSSGTLVVSGAVYVAVLGAASRLGGVVGRVVSAAVRLRFVGDRYEPSETTIAPFKGRRSGLLVRGELPVGEGGRV